MESLPRTFHPKGDGGGVEVPGVIDRFQIEEREDLLTVRWRTNSNFAKLYPFLTAVCLLDPESRKRYEHVDHTTVRFRDFDRRLADAYLHHDEPYDCAGSFKLEGAGFLLFESVRTDDPTALIGLPMIWLADRLLALDYLSP